MATMQPGIFAQGTSSHRHLEFLLRPGTSPEDVFAAVQALRQPSVTAGGANIVVGFGPALWRSLSPGAVPAGLADFPTIAAVPCTQRDVWVWCHGAGQGSLFDIGRAVATLLAPVATVAMEVDAFVYRDSRDLTGFIDGTENPAIEEAYVVAGVPTGRAGAGGSFALTQRWVHDLAAFHALPVIEQEGVIGRTKIASVELADDVKPATAHIARVVIDDGDGELEIYRRSVPYGTVDEHGLHFVAFSADPIRFERMLRSMFGGDDGVHDRLTEFSTPVAGSYWFVPSLEDLGDALG
ncbi:MAG: Dyp-type peroxidase [Actinomycetota bacterium]|nr:Dyp-type peroxidase [Actinomycetota bacterium]